MRKLFMMLVMLFAVYFGIQAAFAYFGKGHEVEYQVKVNDTYAYISETFYTNDKNERDSYYLTIDVDDDVFHFQVFEKFGKSSEILKQVEYYQGKNISCILPIFRDGQVLFDVMCKKDNIIYPFHSLDASTDLGDFIGSLRKFGYMRENFEDSLDTLKTEGPITAYMDNLVSNHYLGISSYKGIYQISSQNGIRSTEIFTQDVYQRPVSVFVNDMYFTADYYQVNQFEKFFLAPLTSEGYKNILMNRKISLNSYIQGVVGNSIYLFDRSSRKQYEIDTKVSNILEVGNQETGVKYYDGGKWSRVDCEDAYKKDLLFGSAYPNDYGETTYDKVVRVGNQDGYYYLFKKIGSKYQVYRTDIRDKKYLTYLFDTTDINRLIYLDQYVYYIDGNYVKYYSDKTGNRTVFKNSEFEFNRTLIYHVYEETKK